MILVPYQREELILRSRVYILTGVHWRIFFIVLNTDILLLIIGQMKIL